MQTRTHLPTSIIEPVEEDPETRRESQGSKKENRITGNLEDALVLWRKDETPEISIPKPKDLRKDKKSSRASFQTKSDPVRPAVRPEMPKAKAMEAQKKLPIVG
jgi:hypothetical protein